MSASVQSITARRIFQKQPEWKQHAAFAFCWAVWATLLVLALHYLVAQASDIPMAEDWLLIPAFAGQQSHFAQWLWEQNNEHRVPLPKLILITVLKLTRGNLKACMLVSLLLVAATAAAMMWAVRSARGGRARFSDAFFPIAFLNAGHWENFYWAWQLTFVLSVVFGCIPLIVLASRRRLGRARALWIGASLVAAPLCGATGLLFVPFLNLWSAYTGIKALRNNEEGPTGWILLVTSLISYAICGLYFVGYYHPAWTGAHIASIQSATTSLEFMALAFGPFARSVWKISIPITFVFVVLTVQTLFAALARSTSQDRSRILGLSAYHLGVLCYAAAIGYGRSHVLAVTYFGFPLRYILLAVPLLCIAYVVLDQLGSSVYRHCLPPVLCGIALLWLPLNVAQGFAWLNVFKADVIGIHYGIRQGMTAEEVAKRFNKYLAPSKSMEEVADAVRMARDAKMFPFSDIRARSAPAVPNGFTPASNASLYNSEIRCRVQGAARVVLVWGVQGWRSLPVPLLPARTVIIDGTMRTTMEQTGDDFTAKLVVLHGEPVDFGFLVYPRDDTDQPDWQPGAEGAHLPESPGFLEFPMPVKIEMDRETSVLSNITAPLMPFTVRYYAPGATNVRVYWGINGWKALPAILRPSGTEISRTKMSSPTIREKDTFVAKLAVPAGATIDYGFWITERSGVMNLLLPIWDGKTEYHAIVNEPTTATVVSDFRHPGLDWLASAPPLKSWLRYIALFVFLWVVLFVALARLGTFKRTVWQPILSGRSVG